MEPLFQASGWHYEDIQALMPKITEEQAREFANDRAKYILDRFTEVGWDIIEYHLDDWARTNLETGGHS